jgi:hypothetical protein
VNQAPAQTLAGIGFVILSVACFAILDTTTKHISASVPILLALWFRYFIQAVFSTVFFLPKRGIALFKTEHPRFQMARGALLFSSSLCAFYGLKYLPVGEFTAIVSITPLVVTLMAALSFGRKSEEVALGFGAECFCWHHGHCAARQPELRLGPYFSLHTHCDQLRLSFAHQQNGEN